RLMKRLNDLGFSPAEAATMIQAEDKAAHDAQIRAAANAAARDAVAAAVDRLRAEKRTSRPLRLEDYPSWERWRDAVRKRAAASGEKIEKIQKTEAPEEAEEKIAPPSRQVLVEKSGDEFDGW